MIKRACAGIVHLVGGLAAGLAIVAVLVAWRLSTGPVSLSFLTPTFERWLSEQHPGFHVRLDDTVVAWAGWERTLDLRVVNARAVGESGAVLARVPEMSLSFSTRALVRGLIVPRRVTLIRPSLAVRRLDDGHLQINFDGGQNGTGGMAQRAVNGLLAEAVDDNPMSYLDRVEIVDAAVAFTDAGWRTTVRIPSADVSLWRVASGLKGGVALDLNADGQKADITLLGEYRHADQRLEVGATFASFRPSSYAGIDRSMRLLDAIDLPLKGTITASLNLDGDVETIGFDVEAAAGHLALPVSAAQDWGILPLAQRLSVAEAHLRGRYERAQHRLEVDAFDMHLADGERIYVPQPAEQELPVRRIQARGRLLGDRHWVEVDDLHVELADEGVLVLPAPLAHSMPLASLSLRGRYQSDRDRLEVAALEADLQGPTLAATVLAENLSTKPAVNVSAILRDMPMDALGVYWPNDLAASGRRWVTTRLRDGVFEEARASAILGDDGAGGLAVEALTGTIRVAGLTVDYLPPMPPARDADGTATFDADRMSIRVDRATAAGMTVRGGTVVLDGLGSPDEYATIDLTMDGAVPDALRLIDHEPLGYASALDIDPDGTDGQSSVQLKLRLALKNDIPLDDVEVSAEADLSDVRLSGVAFGHDVTSGGLGLRVDKVGMDVSGEAVVGAVPGALVWRENFAADAPFRSRFDVVVSGVEAARIRDLGIDLSPLPDDAVTGSLDAQLRVTLTNDRGRRVQTVADLTAADLKIDPLDWAKPPGVPATVHAEVRMIGDRLTGVPQFSLDSPGLTVAGAAAYDAEGKLGALRVDRFQQGRTDVVADATIRPDGVWDIGVRGAALDLEPVLKNLDVATVETIPMATASGAEESEQPVASPEETILLRFRAATELDTVWIGPKQRIDQVSGTFAYDGEAWDSVDVRGQLAGGGALTASIEAGSNNTRVLRVRAGDAGQVLRTFGVYGNMAGGKLAIDGVYHDSEPGRPLSGRATIADYRVINAPMLVEVVSVLALTGILDTLRGDGLGFNTLDAPFTLRDGVLSLDGAAASGMSLGFTASGTIRTEEDIVDLHGTVVPAYVINSALGRIPLVGELFTGGEEGGGVFAATYSMTGSLDDPSLTVNPLSALAPGFLRNVFGIFDELPTTSEVPTEPDDGGASDQ